MCLQLEAVLSAGLHVAASVKSVEIGVGACGLSDLDELILVRERVVEQTFQIVDDELAIGRIVKRMWIGGRNARTRLELGGRRRRSRKTVFVVVVVVENDTNSTG